MVNTRKTETTTTTENEEHAEHLAREECARLGRQLRLMEHDKKAYLDESNAVINQQKKSIQALEAENRNLEAEIEALQPSKSPTSSHQLPKIFSLIDTYISLSSEVERESKIVQEVGKELALASLRLEKLKAYLESSSGGSSGAGGGDGPSNISLEDLEIKEFKAKRKLQTVTSQFDSIVSENSKLRKEIDVILKENERIRGRSKELEETSSKNRHEIDELVEQASQAFDEREEAVAKSNALLDRNEKEKKQFILEINELQRLIRHEEKLLSFMGKKNRDRTFIETEDERLSRLESAKEQTADDALEQYQEHLGKLLTKESPTLESLVEEYAQLSTGNVTNYEYLNGLNNDLEKLQAEVEEMREEIKRCATETVERNKEKMEQIEKKEKELASMKEDIESTQSLVSYYNEFVDEIVKLIQRLFFITDFEEAKVLELMGKGTQSPTISSDNVMLYFNILEGRMKEIFKGEEITDNKIPLSPKETMMMVTGKKDLDVGNVVPTLRPKIVLSTQRTLTSEEDEGASGIIEDEPTPLEYYAMRGKLLDTVSASSRNPSEAGSPRGDNEEEGEEQTRAGAAGHQQGEIKQD